MSLSPNDDRYLPWSPSCKEYFHAFADGRFDERSQLRFILPRERVTIDLGRSAFVVGSAGVDGIDFCFRRGHAGVWAYYPIDEEWVVTANTLADLERGWLNGSITV